MTQEDDLRAEIAHLRTENEQLRRQESAGLRFKVSEKGAVSVYGLGRFPVTLYKEQWLRLLAQADGIRAFIRDNATALKTKEETR
jgi:ribosome-interacting GTPase 1